MTRYIVTDTTTGEIVARPAATRRRTQHRRSYDFELALSMYGVIITALLVLK